MRRVTMPGIILREPECDRKGGAKLPGVERRKTSRP